MATIEHDPNLTHEGFQAQLTGMEDEKLLAQSLVQQGAIHVLGHLLKIGCTEKNVQDMLASLRENSRLIREEASRRGKPDPFANDQTGFN